MTTKQKEYFMTSDDYTSIFKIFNFINETINKVKNGYNEHQLKKLNIPISYIMYFNDVKQYVIFVKVKEVNIFAITFCFNKAKYKIYKNEELYFSGENYSPLEEIEMFESLDETIIDVIEKAFWV